MLIMPRFASLLVLAAIFLLGSAAGRAFAYQDVTKGKSSADAKQVYAAESADDGDDAAKTTTEDKPAKPAEEKSEKPAASVSEKPAGESPRFDPRGTRPGSGSGRDPRRGSSGKSDDGKSVVVDFAGTEQNPAADDKRAAGEPRVTFNFRFAPWSAVLQKFAEVARLNLDMDEPPPGTFNYYDKATYSVKEALDIINGYLIQKGYILVRRDRFLVVANFGKGPVPPNLVPTIPLSELSKRGKNEYVSVVVPLKDINAKTASEEIKDLLGPYPQGKALPMVASNQLLLTDLASHLQHIVEVLEGMSQVQEKGTTMKSFKLEHIAATEAERMLRDLFSLPPRGATTRTTTSEQQTTARFPARQNQDDNNQRGRGRGGRGGGGWNGGGGWQGGGNGFPFQGGGNGFPFQGGGDNQGNGDFGNDPQAMFQAAMAARGNRWNRNQPDGGDAASSAQTQRLTMTIDPRQNTLLVTCSVDDMRLVEDMIKTIDVVVTSDSRGDFLKGDNVPQLEVYSLENADPAVVADVLYSAVPGLIIRDDAKTRGVIVFGTPTEQAQVRGIVKQLDNGTGDSITSLLLRHWDAVAAATSLKALFSSTKVDPPSIEADSIGRRLMVRGSPDQVAQIKRLLAEMGEDGSVPIASASGGGPVRAILPQGRTPAEVLSLVERLFPSTENSLIRVVRPNELGVPSFQLRDVDQPRGRGPSQFRRQVTPFRQGDDGAESPDAGRGFESLPDAGAAPESDGGASRSRGRVPVGGNARFPLGVSRDAKTLTALKAAYTEEETSAAPVAAAPARRPRRSEPSIDELSRQLEEALGDDDETREADGSQEALDEAAAAPKAAAPKVTKDRGQPGELRMTVDGDRILIASNDSAALDKMEQLIHLLSVSGPPKTKWTVYYLRVADATETANMLGYLFPQGTVTRNTSNTGTGLFGRGMFSTQTSSTSDSAALSSLSKGGALRIIPETRSNALFISGDEHEVDQVMDALKVLDSSELPESLKDRVPRMIPVEHADVTEIAEIVRDVYKEQLEGGGQQQLQGGNRGGGFNNPMAAMWMGGMGQQQPQGRGGRNVQLSIGVDTRTSHLVVSASDSLYRQVEALVKSLDESANQARRTVRVVSLQNSNSLVVQQTLGSLLGKVKTSSVRNDKNSTPGNGQTPGQNPNGNPAPGTNSSDADATQVLVQQRMMQRMMQGNNGFGNRGNGGNGGGGRGFGGGQGFGGGRGGGGFGRGGN
jgi:type II secretory pathway component GspD/PulD (secretin)